MIERQLTAEAVRSESICFPHAQSVVRAARKATHKKSGVAKQGVRIFISSLEPAGPPVAGRGRARPARFAKLVLGHWRVENNIHWLRDAVGDEDRCRSRDPNAACALTQPLRQAQGRVAAPGAARPAPCRRPPQPHPGHGKLRKKPAPRPRPFAPSVPCLAKLVNPAKFGPANFIGCD